MKYILIQKIFVYLPRNNINVNYYPFMRYITTIISLTALVCTVTPVKAQTSRAELLAHMELASGNYCNYPLPTGQITPAPDGYEPFYVSHYGRHGARYMTGSKPFRYVIGKMDSAQAKGLLTEKGEEVLQEWLKRNQLEMTSSTLEKLCELHDIKKADSLLQSLGDKTVLLNEKDADELRGKNKQQKQARWKKFVPFINSGKKEEKAKDEERSQDLLIVGKDFNKKKPIFISEQTIDKYIFPPCCHPIPGDDTLGYIDNKGRIEIHKRACPVASKLKAGCGNRILDAKWNMHKQLFFDATIRIRGIDRQGLLLDLAEVVSDKLGINIRKIVISTDNGIFDGSIEIRIHDREEVNVIMEKLKAIEGLQEVSQIM